MRNSITTLAIALVVILPACGGGGGGETTPTVLGGGAGSAGTAGLGDPGGTGAVAGSGGTSVVGGAGGTDAVAGSGGTSGIETGGTGAVAGAGGTGGMELDDETCPAAPANLPTNIVESIAFGDPINLKTLGAFTHPMLSAAIQVKLWLPTGYDPTSRRYPVLYAHDGQSFARSSGPGIEAAAADGVPVEPHIVVGIDSSSARVDLLTPWPQNAPAPDKQVIPMGVGGKGDYLDELMIDTIKPYIDAHYSTKCGRQNTTVMGYSLGGIMCLHQLVKHPEVFGRAHCISSAFWWDGDHVIQEFRDYAGPLPLRLWLDIGGGEDPHTVSLIPQHEVLGIALEKGMILGENLGYYEEPGKLHVDGETRPTRVPWVFWSVADLNHELLATDVLLHEFSVEIPVWMILNPPADVGVGEASIRRLFLGGYQLTLPNSMATFTSSNMNVATVDDTGHVEATGPGMATISAMVDGVTLTHTFTGQ